MSRFVLLSIGLILAIVLGIALMLPSGVYSAGPATEPALTFVAPTSAPLYTPTATATVEPQICKTTDDCPGPPSWITATPTPTATLRTVVCGKEPCEGTPPPLVSATPEPPKFQLFLPALANCSECLSAWPIMPDRTGGRP